MKPAGLVRFPPAEFSQMLRHRPRYICDWPDFRPSAVLVPLLMTDGQDPEVLFIVRTATLPTHAGQVAFPGGKMDAEDPTLEHTALRENREELGILAEQVTVLGLLDDVPSPHFFSITPVVGLVSAPVQLCPNRHEVADTFTLPLYDLPRLYRPGKPIRWRGVTYVMHEFAHPKYHIWGATAAVLRQLLFLLGLAEDDGRLVVPET